MTMSTSETCSSLRARWRTEHVGSSVTRVKEKALGAPERHCAVGWLAGHQTSVSHSWNPQTTVSRVFRSASEQIPTDGWQQRWYLCLLVCSVLLSQSAHFTQTSMMSRRCKLKMMGPRHRRNSGPQPSLGGHLTRIRHKRFWFSRHYTFCIILMLQVKTSHDSPHQVDLRKTWDSMRILDNARSRDSAVRFLEKSSTLPKRETKKENIPLPSPGLWPLSA